MKHTKTKPIYISDRTKAVAKKICIKYKISLSTLCQELTLITLNKCNPDNYDLLRFMILEDSQKKLTYIKPKFDYVPFETEKQQNHYISNILYLYVNKKLTTIFTKEQEQKITSKLNSNLQKKREVFWDLNNVIRQQKRANQILGIKK